MRLGIMGGTFDPIHWGHLVTAEAARHQFKLDQVLFVPSGQPPHKQGRKVSSPEHRYLMTFLAIANNPMFHISRLEIDRPGFTYTYDTVSHLKAEYGQNIELFFITGADVMRDILTWYKAEELLSICHFVAASRPGFTLLDYMAHADLSRFKENGSIHLIEVPAMAISSTDLRRRITIGEPIRYLVPEAVENYIYKNHLYVPDDGATD
ncbi:MAG: nicotinate-nucleotide adenylyltransferase [Bacillota bacterium]|nr:MAG: nicotinate-nucleotide adenylyltransferase [Bacillota bacterium]MBS3951093.1 nicotinate-nucleotide adenylyltransferase [Peptococcaceae bacterium]